MDRLREPLFGFHSIRGHEGTRKDIADQRVEGTISYFPPMSHLLLLLTEATRLVHILKILVFFVSLAARVGLGAL